MEKKIAVREENPFEEPEVAQQWITSVEKETGQARDQFIYPLLKNWLANPKLQDVLDLGAGQGVAAQFCEGKKYVGLEPSLPLIRRAKEKYGSFGEFVQGEAYHVPFADQSFDGVFSINVWFHLANLAQASAEAARVLRPQGELLLVNPNPAAYDVWVSFYKALEQDGKKFVGRVQIPHSVLTKNTFYQHSEQEIVGSLSEAGIVVKETATFAPVNGKDIFRSYQAVKK